MVRYSLYRKIKRNFIVVTLGCLAFAGFAAAQFSYWYLWHLASRGPNPSRGLIYPRTVGDSAEFGQQFTVYLSSTESLLLSPLIYLLIGGSALLFLSSQLSWSFPLKKTKNSCPHPRSSA